MVVKKKWSPKRYGAKRNSRPAKRQSQQSTTGLRRTMSIEFSDSYVKPRPTFKQRFVKFLRIVLIFFYGQFFANAIYTHLIHGIPLVQAEPDSFYPNLKVGLGIVMVIHTLLSLMFVWNRNWCLILVSAISLVILSSVTLITSIVDLTQRKERGALVEHEFGSTIAEIIVEFTFRAFAVIMSLLMVKFIRDMHGLNMPDVDEEDDLEDKSGDKDTELQEMADSAEKEEDEDADEDNDEELTK